MIGVGGQQVIGAQHQVGALHSVLDAFKLRGINLTRMFTHFNPTPLFRIVFLYWPKIVKFWSKVWPISATSCQHSCVQYRFQYRLTGAWAFRSSSADWFNHKCSIVHCFKIEELQVLNHAHPRQGHGNIFSSLTSTVRQIKRFGCWTPCFSLTNRL